MVNPDPKHGRWILPLIIVAMIVLTFTFVNSLEPASTEAGTTTTTTTQPPPTTTTLPSEVAAYLVSLDAFESQARGFQDQLVGVNDDWENRTITQGETEDGFLGVRDAISVWESEVNLAEVPASLAAGHVDLVQAIEDLAPKIDDVVLGLLAPDDGTLRRTAINEFRNEVQDVLDAIDVLREEAAQSGAPAETGAGDDTGEPSGGVEGGSDA